VCPTTLATVKQVEERLGSRRDQVITVFVSVDPDRDTPAVLKEYVDHFGINVVAATGAKPEIDRIVEQYKAHYAIVPSDSALGYLVEHTAILYLIDQDGRVRYLFRYGDPAGRIVEGVTQLLR
jgi:protein SCO1/2